MQRHNYPVCELTMAGHKEILNTVSEIKLKSTCMERIKHPNDKIYRFHY